MDVGNGKYLEKVRNFCYLEEVLNETGGSTTASLAKITMCMRKI